jgi:signal-transduction protein with cAMP-binding, CBS, and nucleotidyltransferase domain
MSTFDIFTQLPLFKEIEKEALFSLVPKISLDFEHYQEKETLFTRHSPVNGLIFLLQGQIRLLNDVGESVLSAPTLLSTTGIFGKYRIHSDEATALTNCSILNVDRRSLIYLIRTEPAFLEAFLGMMSDSLFSIHTPH